MLHPTCLLLFFLTLPDSVGSPLCKSTSGQACSRLVPISSSDVSPHIRSHVVDWVVCQHFFLSPGCPMTALATCIPTLEWNTVTSFHSRSVFSVLTYFCHSLPCCCDKTLTKSAEGGRRCLPIIALSIAEESQGRNRIGGRGGSLFTGLLSMFCSACFLTQLRTTCPTLALPVVSWSRLCQSLIKKIPPRFVCVSGQSDRGGPWVEGPSQMTPAAVKLTKTQTSSLWQTKESLKQLRGRSVESGRCVVWAQCHSERADLRVAITG